MAFVATRDRVATLAVLLATVALELRSQTITHLALVTPIHIAVTPIAIADTLCSLAKASFLRKQALQCHWFWTVSQFTLPRIARALTAVQAG